MIEDTTIWVRRRLAAFNEGLREFVRRQVRKLVELVVTDIDLMARLRDAGASAVFEERHLRDAAGYKTRGALHKAVLREIAGKPGLRLEFGVYKGDSINHFAELDPSATWYGFDSFEGLPEAWTTGAKQAAFTVGGHLPPVRRNVRLIKGFFNDTLPRFATDHAGEKLALLHIDCDLYSSTVTILDNLGGMLAPGSVILFDELINYHGWEVGEYKAFTEFATARQLAFEYMAYNRTGSQVAVRILGAAASPAATDHVAATGR